MKYQVVGFIGLVALLGAVGCAGGAGDNKPKLAELREGATPAEVAFHNGMKAAIDDDWSAAASNFEEAIKLHEQGKATGINQGDATSARVNLGIALEESGDLEAATDAYKAVLDLDPKNGAAAANYARVAMAVGKGADAASAMGAAVEANPSDVGLLLIASSAFRAAKRFDEAAKSAREVLKLEPENTGAIKALALVNLDQGRLQLAEMFFKQARAKLPDDASILVNLGLIAKARGNDQAALFWFEDALKVNATEASALYNIGALSLAVRDYGRAASMFQSAIDNGMAKSCDAVSALGFANEGLLDQPKAMELLGQALELCPERHEWTFAMGTMCMSSGDLKCAQTKYEAFVSAQSDLPKDHPARLRLAEVRSMIDSQAEYERQAAEAQAAAEAAAAEAAAAEAAAAEAAAAEAAAAEAEAEAAEGESGEAEAAEGESGDEGTDQEAPTEEEGTDDAGGASEPAAEAPESA